MFYNYVFIKNVGLHILVTEPFGNKRNFPGKIHT